MVSLLNSRTTSLNVSMTSCVDLISLFLNPLLRISFHICSMGFISGVLAGRWKNTIFFGMTRSFLDLCQLARSKQSSISSSGNFSDNAFRKMFIFSELLFSKTRNMLSPSMGIPRRTQFYTAELFETVQQGAFWAVPSNAPVLWFCQNWLHPRTLSGLS